MNMNSLSASLSAALVEAGASHVQAHYSGTVFANGFGIYPSATGNVMARSVYDSADRFSIGTCNDSAATLAANFIESVKHYN